jgi:hypothetical protein
MTFYMLEMTELWNDGRRATSAENAQLYDSSEAIVFGRCAEREKGGRSLPLGIKTLGVLRNCLLVHAAGAEQSVVQSQIFILVLVFLDQRFELDRREPGKGLLFLQYVPHAFVFVVAE